LSAALYPFLSNSNDGITHNTRKHNASAGNVQPGVQTRKQHSLSVPASNAVCFTVVRSSDRVFDEGVEKGAVILSRSAAESSALAFLSMSSGQ
jgi:hypothetical protein